MKYRQFLLCTLCVIAPIFLSCQNDEGCDTNATLNGDCFNLAIEYSTENFGGSQPFSREVLVLIFQFPPNGPQERVRFAIRSDDPPMNAPASGTLQFEPGTMYSGSTGSMIFNGDLSAGGIPGIYEYRFTKIDRENDVVSGEIEFSYSNDFGSDEFTATFENAQLTVPVGEEF